MLPAFYRKVFRDLWRMRGQTLAIALVIAAGISTLLMSRITHDSLSVTLNRVYQDYAFTDVWADLRRAPESIADRIALMPGVASVETRIFTTGRMNLPGFDEPVTISMQSIPDSGEQPLHDRLHLRSGRLPLPWATDETVISFAFAQAHKLKLGTRVQVTVYGRRQWFTVVGIAASPEYILQVKPGSMIPDDERYAVLWTPRQALASALDMEGAFNRLSVRLSPDAHSPASEADLLDEIDRELQRWGSQQAYGRHFHLSHRSLEEELKQLATMAAIYPAIFLGVAAFLVNVVFGRLIATQRAQIAILKAFGYSTGDVILHYSLMAMLVALLGSVAGLGFGYWLGTVLAQLYQDNYQFPYLHLVLSPESLLLGIGVAMLAAVLGAARAVLAAAREPVAQAMRPVPPERYGATLLERLPFLPRLSQPTRMILRQIERRPWRAVLSVTGLALAGAIIILARLQVPTLTYLVDLQFRLTEHHDISVSFIEARSRQALYELQAIPGVHHAEGGRAVPVILSRNNRRFNLAIEGIDEDGQLFSPLNDRLKPLQVPRHGLMIGKYLAEQLGVSIGDTVRAEVLGGRQRTLDLPVTALSSDMTGMRLYMNLDALNRALGDGDVVSQALLLVERGSELAVLDRLNDLPQVSSADQRTVSLKGLFEMLSRVSGPFTGLSILLGCIVNLGVVYTSARITLAERGHELASLRVLGFTQAEISRIVLGEMILLVAASIPLSFAAGWGLSWIMTQGLQNEQFRIPLYIPPSNYAFGVLITLCSTAVSMLIVLRLVRRLNMIEALKVHE